jgi:hypothetical protein
LRSRGVPDQVRVFTPFSTIARYGRARSAKYAFPRHLPQSRGMAELAVPSTRFHAIYHNREVWQSLQCQVRVFTPYTTIARYDRARSAKYAFSRHFSILPWGFLPMKQHCLSAGDHPPCLKWVCRDNYPWIEAASQRETGCFV